MLSSSDVLLVRPNVTQAEGAATSPREQFYAVNGSLRSDLKSWLVESISSVLLDGERSEEFGPRHVGLADATLGSSPRGAPRLVVQLA